MRSSDITLNSKDYTEIIQYESSFSQNDKLLPPWNQFEIPRNVNFPQFYKFKYNFPNFYFTPSGSIPTASSAWILSIIV